MEAETLLDWAADRRVRQSKGFREIAEELNGEKLAALYARQRERAPRRAAAGKRFFAKHPQRVGKRIEEHVARALLRFAEEGGGPLAFDDVGSLLLVDWGVPLASGAPDKTDPADPNRGVGKVDLLGLSDDGLAVAALKYLPPDAKRGTTGDTPLRALLETLAASAIITANLEDLRKEAEERFGIAPSSSPPAVFVIGSPRYWELCRRREAQKGARWIRELERLAGEIEEHLSIPVRYLSLALADPGIETDERGPRLTGPCELGPAWEPRAGVVKPRAAPRPRAQALVDEVIEPDLDRPVRSYVTSESYMPGDRIQHPTLGLGVVQSITGPSKIRVRFDEEDRVLVHNRTAAEA